MKDELRPELNPFELRCLSLAARGRTREDITRETDIGPATSPTRFFAPSA